MGKLTDRQKKKIIADYVDCGNYSEVARKYKVSASTVKRVVDANPDTQRKVEQKKEKNTLDVLDYLDGKTSSFKQFTDYMYERLDPAKAGERLRDVDEIKIVTMFGILADKMLKAKEIRIKNNVSNPNEQLVDDPLSAALKERAEGLDKDAGQ